MPLIIFSAKRIFSQIGLGLLLANMLFPLEAYAFDASNFLGDKTMSDIQKRADQKAHIASNNEQHADVNDSNVQVKQPEASYEAPYPFTAEELWEKLLKVVDLPDGHVTKEGVEKIFGVTLKLDEEYLKKFHGYLYYLKDQYIYLTFIEKSETESHFQFEWAQRPGQHPIAFPHPPTGMCINALKITHGIEERGWELKLETRNMRDLLNRNDYRKGELGGLRMEFFPYDNCFASIDIYTNKLVSHFIP